MKSHEDHHKGELTRSVPIHLSGSPSGKTESGKDDQERQKPENLETKEYEEGFRKISDQKCIDEIVTQEEDQNGCATADERPPA
jgi:hypothetical protein